MRRLRVLLDANVIVDAQVRDLFCRAAEAGLIDIRWSAEILEETSRVLTVRLRLDPSKVRRLMMALGDAFPGASVAGYQSIQEQLHLPDPDDHHVLAAAVVGECDWLVTDNVDDFPDAIAEKFDLLVVSADDAVVLLAGVFATQIANVVDEQIASLRRPPASREEYLERLGRRAPMGALAIGAALGVKQYQRMFREVLDAGDDDSPQGAVRRLLDAIDHNDAALVAAMVDPELARRLTGHGSPAPRDVLAALDSLLADVRNGNDWGFATARRIQGPDLELVKLLRVSSKPLLVTEPQQAVGHLFFMRRRDDAWILWDLDGPDPAVSAPPGSRSP